MNFGSLFKVAKTIVVWVITIYVAALSALGLWQMMCDFTSWVFKTNKK